MNTPTPSAWYLIQCKPRQDRRAYENLLHQHYQCFLPLCKRERLLRGKKKTAEEPLFPGYLFIRLDCNSNWAPLRSTRGVSRLVGFGGTPQPVSDELIAQLQERTTQLPPAPLLQAGDNVRVSDGPFAELDAIFLSMDGEQRVVLLMSLLQRQQAVRMPLSMIRKT